MTRRSEQSFQWRGNRLDFLLYEPQRGEAATRLPLILFLHGAGERGTAVGDVRRHGIPKEAEALDSFPFVAVCPQCPPRTWWTELTPVLHALLATVSRRPKIDRDRIYLTGMSMGGYGVFKLAAEDPDRFAAAAPVCGGGDPRWASQLAALPIWAFHGSDDRVVPPEESVRMVRALERVGAPVKLTIYPDTGHDSWTRTYADPELYEWFLRHRARPRPGGL